MGFFRVMMRQFGVSHPLVAPHRFGRRVHMGCRARKSVSAAIKLDGKPILASWMGGPTVDAGEAILNSAGIPTFKYPDRAARAFELLHPPQDCYGGRASAVAGGLFVAYSLLVYPMLNILFGHGWPIMPTFGAPCPIVIFTFGVLLWTNPAASPCFLVIPLVWAVVGTTAAMTLGMPEDAAMGLAAVIAAFSTLGLQSEGKASPEGTKESCRDHVLLSSLTGLDGGTFVPSVETLGFCLSPCRASTVTKNMRSMYRNLFVIVLGHEANSVPAPSCDRRIGDSFDRPADQPAPRTDRNS
jgi:Family of unknown function (DUF6064)